MFNKPEFNNSHYNDCYFSYDDGLEEALYVFIDGNGFPKRLFETDKIAIAETGFGTGLNLIALIKSLKDATISNKKIEFYSVEKYPLNIERIEELLANFINTISVEWEICKPIWNALYKNLKSGWNSIEFEVFGNIIVINLYFGDVVEMLDSLNCDIECWFLDGHSPDKNPDMWNSNIMAKVGENSKSGTTIATFSAAGVVKSGLRDAGFFIKRRKGFGGKRHMITGYLE